MPARRLRLSPEWQCWPIWDEDSGENLDPADLDLPEALRIRVTVWDDVFQALYDIKDPREADFETPAQAAAWRAEGKAIAGELSRVLGSGPIRLRL